MSGKKSINLALKVLASIILVVVVVFITSSPGGMFDHAKNRIDDAFNRNFQFGEITSIIEERYGTLTAFLPSKMEKNEEVYSPVLGRETVGLEVKKSGDGFLVDVGSLGKVSSLTEGVVTFAGEDKTYGPTVVVESGDGSKVVYYGLESIFARTYQHIEAGDLIGKSKVSGEYFLVVEKNN